MVTTVVCVYSRSQVGGTPDHVLSSLQNRSLQPFRRYPARHLKVQRVPNRKSNPVHVPVGGSAFSTTYIGHLITRFKMKNSHVEITKLVVGDHS